MDWTLNILLRTKRLRMSGTDLLSGSKEMEVMHF